MTQLPTFREMYDALLNKDSAFEGIFWVGVRTTGVFCRPTCSARKPKIENVEFFSSPQEALYSGYRPCARCNPMDRYKEAPDLVKRLRHAVEQSPLKKLSDTELSDMGIDPSTARRQFQRYYGMTFHAYHRARRMGMALREIRNGESVIGAQIDNGFESASGFFDAFRNVFGRAPSSSESVNCLYARWIDTPLGAMLAIAGDDGLYLLEFVDRRGLEREIAQLRKRIRSIILPGDYPHLRTTEAELKRYFDGESMSFSVPLVMTGSAFEENVWEALRSIPPGKTRSYAQIAEQVGRPNANRAIGNANGRNKLAIVIPCHRVIRSDGELCGYGGGVWRKKWLVDHESSSDHR